jgi:hypothetical protein
MIIRRSTHFLISTTMLFFVISVSWSLKFARRVNSWHEYVVASTIRDRPFNLWGGYGFLFRSEFFFLWTTRELEYLFLLLCKARIFFPEFNIRLYDKNSESNFFFLPPKSEYFFQQHWESEYFFRKKP